jgi:hypothetical protein
MTTKVLLIGGALLAGTWLASAQQTYSGPIRYGTSAGVCSYVGELWIDTSGTPTLKTCTVMSPVTWVTVGGGGGSAVPAGAMLLVDAGTCPTGFAEVSGLDGKFLVGTLAANGNVGTSAGSDTVTPAGTVTAPTFTGNAVASSAVSAGTPAGTNGTVSFTPDGTVTQAIFTGAPLATHTHMFTGTVLATHAHELPFQIPTTTTLRPIAIATFGTGTARAATSVSPAFTANTTSAAVALSQAISAGTPAGTNAAVTAGTPAGTINAQTFAGTGGTVPAPTFTGSPLGTHSHTTTASGSISAPTFTGSSLDNRPAFTRVIVCKKT